MSRWHAYGPSPPTSREDARPSSPPQLLAAGLLLESRITLTPACPPCENSVPGCILPRHLLACLASALPPALACRHPPVSAWLG
eukprot:1582630-Heterocapsa_arctica.AAC.1